MAGEEPIVENVVSTPAADAPVVALPVEPAVVAPEAPKHPHEIPTLLETLKSPGAEPAKAAEKPAEVPADKTEPKAAEVKPEAKAEVKPDADKPAVEEKPAEVSEPEPPVEYKFEFPDHVKPQDEKVAAFTAFAREHKLSPEAAQKAVGYFNEAATAFVAEQAAKQIQVWNDTRSDWRKQVLADAMIGGPGHMHAMGVVARVRDMTISDAQPGTPQYEKDAKEVDDFLRTTGAGDHPAFLKMLYRAGARLDEPKQPTIPPQPPKNNGKRPSNSLYASK